MNYDSEIEKINLEIRLLKEEINLIKKEKGNNKSYSYEKNYPTLSDMKTLNKIYKMFHNSLPNVMNDFDW